MKALLPDAVAYKTTPEFDQDSIPQGLLRSHTTMDGSVGTEYGTHAFYTNPCVETGDPRYVSHKRGRGSKCVATVTRYQIR